VATRRERHQHGLHDIFLAHDGLGDRAAQPLGGFGRPLEEGRIGGCGGQAVAAVTMPRFSIPAETW
jgi:hypothetical protein